MEQRQALVCDDNSSVTLEYSLINEEDDSVESSGTFIFPKEVPKAKYLKPARGGFRSDAGKAVDEEWKAFSAFQAKDGLKTRVQVPTIDLNKEQSILLILLIQPKFKQDNAQLYVKLQIEKLMLGVPGKDFICKDECLGYYPYFIQIEIGPEIDGECFHAIPILENLTLLQSQSSISNEDTIASATSTKIEGQLLLGPARLMGEKSWRSSTDKDITASATSSSIEGKLGFGPAHLKAGISWQSSVDETKEHVQLVSIEHVDSGNAASFEWSILRWQDGTKYSPTQLRPAGTMIPFQNGCANLTGFPEILWRFPLSFKEKKLQFRIKMHMEMQLSSPKGMNIVPLKYENIWELKD